MIICWWILVWCELEKTFLKHVVDSSRGLYLRLHLMLGWLRATWEISHLYRSLQSSVCTWLPLTPFWFDWMGVNPPKKLCIAIAWSQHQSGQIIATSHDLTPKCWFSKGNLLFQGNITIWPDQWTISFSKPFCCSFHRMFLFLQVIGRPNQVRALVVIIAPHTEALVAVKLWGFYWLGIVTCT